MTVKKNVKRKLGSVHFDWLKIKSEYMLADDTVSVSEVLRNNGIKRGNIGPYSAKTVGWPDERKALRIKQMEAIKKQTIKATVDEFDEYIRLLEVTRKQIAMFLRGNIKQTKDGSYILKNDNVGRLSEASLAIERVLKCHRLIRGKSTDNVAVANYHMAIVKLIEETKAGKIIELPQTTNTGAADDNNPK